MIAEIEKVNSRDDLDNLTVYSSDIEAMYPSLHMDTIAKVAAEEFLNSRLDVDVDWLELSLYLAVTLSREELV